MYKRQVLSSSIDAEYSGTAVFYLKDLNGKDGFRLDGASSKDESGFAVSGAGDMNKDGYHDIIIGAPKANGNAGESYVVFGKRSWSRYMRLSSLNGKTGFTLTGVEPDDYSGISVAAAGDVDKDGYGDVLIGAYYADPERSTSTVDGGIAYVFFGKKSGYKSTFDLDDINGSNGFKLDGAAEDDLTGWSVGPAGDVDGDGWDDFLVAAPGGQDEYLYRGANSHSSTIDLANFTAFPEPLFARELPISRTVDGSIPQVT